MTTRPTWLGWAVAGVAVAGFALGWLFGGRSLNVVVVPAAVAVVFTGILVARYDRPTVVRTSPEHGHQGEVREVELVVDARSSYPVSLVESLDDGLRGQARHETVADGRHLTYDVTFAERGEHAIGPLSMTATDPLGLWRRTFFYRRIDDVTVFPRVHDITEGADLLTGYIGVTDERGQFDSLREYQRGDPLRDVNWKASAKRPGDLVVTTYAGEGATNRVTIAAEAIGPRADSVAEGAASVACHLLDAGISVGLVTPDGEVSPATGEPHRRTLLGHLALLGRGPLTGNRKRDADIVIRAPASGGNVEISAGEHAQRYREFVGARRAES